MKTVFMELRCPFCGYAIEQSKELKERKLREFPLGVCDHCGAVYAYDVTGHNRGAAFVEALLFACNYDDYLAFSLSAGEDYSDAIVEHYDAITHSVILGEGLDDRTVRGVLIFVKLNREFQEVTEEKVKEKIKVALPSSSPKLRSEKFSREKVRKYLSENKFEEIIALAEEDSRVISEIHRMLYTPDIKLRWRIIEILSEASKKIGEKRPDEISKFLNRLLNSAADSASSAWGAMESVGAIISANPDLFGEFSQPLLSFLLNKDIWNEVTWAIGKIATTKPDLVKKAYPVLCSFLKNPDPTLRGYAAWALGMLGIPDVKEELKKLEADNQRLSLYEEGELKEKTVAQLAKEAIEKLTAKQSS
ncbi:MAG: DVU0298 family protein [Nitrospirota bacterium]